MLQVHEIDSHVALQPLGLLVAVPAPGAALDFFRPLILITAHDAVVDHHQAAAAFEEFLEIGALFADDLHAVLGVDHEHVGVVELLRRREIHRAVGLGAALVEQFFPIGEEPRVIVLVRSVGLDSGADEDA